MPKNTTPKSKWYEQYAKEYRRLTQAIRRQEKLGYVIPESIIPVAPSKMAKILKSDVQKLAKLTPEKIREKSYTVDPATGEAISGKGLNKKKSKRKTTKKKSEEPKKPKKRKPKKHPPAQEPQELDPFWYGDDIENVPDQQRQYYPGFENIAITGYLNQLKQFPNAEGARILTSWISNLIDRFGRLAVATMLDEGSRDGNVVTWETVYKGGVQIYMTNMLEYLPGISQDDKETLVGIMEQMESWENPA